jgi:hypothetical protein
MSSKQCARILPDNSQCTALVSSTLTGELCTKCYFEAKRASNTSENKSEKPLEERIGNQSNSIPEPINPYDNPDVPIPTDVQLEYDIKKEHQPGIDKNAPDKTKKYCQSCIERGYGLKLATREWSKDYFICDDCFEPLVNSLVNYDATRAEVERVKNLPKRNEPFINQFYELMSIPEPLRFTRSEEILQLKNRNDIFVHHAQALVNMNLEEVKAQIENYQVMLFQVKIGLEPLTDYINKIKHEERTKANIEGIKKSKAEVTKVKMSKEEKEAKALGMTLEKYQEMVKKAKLREFNKITGQKDDEGPAPMIK